MNRKVMLGEGGIPSRNSIESYRVALAFDAF